MSEVGFSFRVPVIAWEDYGPDIVATLEEAKLVGVRTEVSGRRIIVKRAVCDPLERFMTVGLRVDVDLTRAARTRRLAANLLSSLRLGCLAPAPVRLEFE